MRSSYKETNEPNLYVWNPRAEEETKEAFYIVDPRLMDFGDANKDDSLATSVESIYVEEVLNYFRDIKAIIEQPSKVRRYLYRHPEIAELSQNVSYIIYKYFDFRAQLSLQIQDDEAPDSEYLAIYIRVPEYDSSVMDRIRKIRESYYDSLNDMTGWFLLTTDFNPPR